MLFLMLPETFKADVLEIISIAKECPESLQTKCLEMLLEHYLNLSRAPTPKREPTEKQDKKEEAPVAEPPVLPDDGSVRDALQSDLLNSDLHVKARRFLEKNGRTIEDLNELFFKDGEEVKPLYDDLKTTKSSESQIRIALLQALRSGIKDGEFQFDGEKVREECQLRKAYDGANFAANFRNNAALFESFEKYEKTSPVIKLSEAGRKRLAELMAELK